MTKGLKGSYYFFSPSIYRLFSCANSIVLISCKTWFGVLVKSKVDSKVKAIHFLRVGGEGNIYSISLINHTLPPLFYVFLCV